MRTQYILLLICILISICNTTNVKNKKNGSDNDLTHQDKKHSKKESQLVQKEDNQHKDGKNKFKHFSDYVKESNKAQKDLIIQFMEIDELKQYQARFLIMSLLAVFTVALCCFGVKYILNFSKTCKTAISELKWYKEVEAQQNLAQNVFTEY